MVTNTAENLFIKNEPLAAHTTFRIGGPSELYVRPERDIFISAAVSVLKKARNEEKAIFILGGGSNIIPDDSGFRGIVLDTTAYSGCSVIRSEESTEIAAYAGTKSDELSDFAMDSGLGGLEFLAGLPGTVGGAVWMNARCYEKSISDILGDVTIIDENFEIQIVPFLEDEFDYKKSPYQKRKVVICETRFRVTPENKDDIRAKMNEYRKDRESKGHFSYPSAGSVFKNNRSFGKPSGKIVEELGMRGMQIGGARIADWHGNFIINLGGASSSDVKKLVELVQKTACEKFGIMLEPEIIFL